MNSINSRWFLDSQQRGVNTTSRMRFRWKSRVLTYNRFNTGTKRILLNTFEMLLSDPTTRPIFPELPLVSYRRDRNRRDYLVHSAERSDSDAGTFARRRPRCWTCRHTTSQTILQVPSAFIPFVTASLSSPRMWSTPSYVVAAVPCTLVRLGGGCGNASVITCVAFVTILLAFL